MIITTTGTVEGRPVKDYIAVVSGEAVIGANIFRDLRSQTKAIRGARRVAPPALREMEDEARRLGADAIVGVSVVYEGGVSQGTMMMVACTGTAVRLG
ncbi:MAG: YbjQ family protein [Alphaproteobacteria bacterium]|nr:YbjQ family protein [Alphaproteobacteria bacterium]